MTTQDSTNELKSLSIQRENISSATNEFVESLPVERVGYLQLNNISEALATLQLIDAKREILSSELEGVNFMNEAREAYRKYILSGRSKKLNRSNSLAAYRGRWDMGVQFAENPLTVLPPIKCLLNGELTIRIDSTNKKLKIPSIQNVLTTVKVVNHLDLAITPALHQEQRDSIEEASKGTLVVDWKQEVLSEHTVEPIDDGIVHTGGYRSCSPDFWFYHNNTEICDKVTPLDVLRTQELCLASVINTLSQNISVASNRVLRSIGTCGRLWERVRKAELLVLKRKTHSAVILILAGNKASSIPEKVIKLANIKRQQSLVRISNVPSTWSEKRASPVDFSDGLYLNRLDFRTWKEFRKRNEVPIGLSHVWHKLAKLEKFTIKQFALRIIRRFTRNEEFLISYPSRSFNIGSRPYAINSRELIRDENGEFQRGCSPDIPLSARSSLENRAFYRIKKNRGARWSRSIKKYTTDKSQRKARVISVVDEVACNNIREEVLNALGPLGSKQVNDARDIINEYINDDEATAIKKSVKFLRFCADLSSKPIEIPTKWEFKREVSFNSNCTYTSKSLARRNTPYVQHFDCSDILENLDEEVEKQSSRRRAPRVSAWSEPVGTESDKLVEVVRGSIARATQERKVLEQTRKSLALNENQVITLQPTKSINQMVTDILSSKENMVDSYDIDNSVNTAITKGILEALLALKTHDDLYVCSYIIPMLNHGVSRNLGQSILSRTLQKAKKLFLSDSNTENMEFKWERSIWENHLNLIENSIEALPKDIQPNTQTSVIKTQNLSPCAAYLQGRIPPLMNNYQNSSLNTVITRQYIDTSLPIRNQSLPIRISTTESNPLVNKVKLDENSTINSPIHRTSSNQRPTSLRKQSLIAKYKINGVASEYLANKDKTVRLSLSNECPNTDIVTNSDQRSTCNPQINNPKYRLSTTSPIIKVHDDKLISTNDSCLSRSLSVSQSRNGLTEIHDCYKSSDGSRLSSVRCSSGFEFVSSENQPKSSFISDSTAGNSWNQLSSNEHVQPVNSFTTITREVSNINRNSSPNIVNEQIRRSIIQQSNYSPNPTKLQDNVLTKNSLNNNSQISNQRTTCENFSNSPNKALVQNYINQVNSPNSIQFNKMSQNQNITQYQNKGMVKNENRTIGNNDIRVTSNARQPSVNSTVKTYNCDPVLSAENSNRKPSISKSVVNSSRINYIPDNCNINNVPNTLNSRGTNQVNFQGMNNINQNHWQNIACHQNNQCYVDNRQRNTSNVKSLQHTRNHEIRNLSGVPHKSNRCAIHPNESLIRNTSSSVNPNKLIMIPNNMNLKNGFQVRGPQHMSDHERHCHEINKHRSTSAKVSNVAPMFVPMPPQVDFSRVQRRATENPWGQTEESIRSMSMQGQRGLMNGSSSARTVITPQVQKYERTNMNFNNYQCVQNGIVDPKYQIGFIPYYEMSSISPEKFKQAAHLQSNQSRNCSKNQRYDLNNRMGGHGYF